MKKGPPKGGSSGPWTRGDPSRNRQWSWDAWQRSSTRDKALSSALQASLVEVKQELQDSESEEEEEEGTGVPVVLLPRVNTPPQEDPELENKEPSPQPKKKAITKRMPKKSATEGTEDTEGAEGSEGSPPGPPMDVADEEPGEGGATPVRVNMDEAAATVSLEEAAEKAEAEQPDFSDGPGDHRC